MKILIEKAFKKDLKKINNSEINKSIYDLILEIKSYDSIYQIKNIKKLKNSKNNYRIRLGNFRIGLEYSDETLIFIRFLHRKDIYKYFPK